ncbi:hypothetical protein PFISCL1PPCAC_27903, partial [Pristionchus fissidentatus]
SALDVIRGVDSALPPSDPARHHLAMISSLHICNIDLASMQGCLLLRPPPKPFIKGIIEGFYGAPWTQFQRRDLLRTLAQRGLNTYVYAPKDDLKHRKDWRDKYGTEEAAELQSLIEYAKSLCINFVYALSPGVDIEYSKVKDIGAVKAKLGQLKSIGCESFALLFDDIEYKLSDADESQFGTPANAQVAVVNDCYTHLNSPAHFYFCPTEYCSTRAKPTLLESDYLRTIGDRLHPGIEIFWTGPLVVPAIISDENARSIAMVLKRKALIWDNLYANDYDTKRIFLGPFKGRSQSLKKECAGILLNPNCQFEVNIPSIISYSDWLTTDEDGSDTDDSSMTIDQQSNRFIPSTSFERTMAKWLKDLVVPIIPLRIRLNEIDFNSSISSQQTTYSLITDFSPNETSKMILEEQRSLEEPMDRSPSCDSDISMADSGRFTGIYEGSSLTNVQLCALAHCYYLPFEHGPTAHDILNGVLWMYRHASVMSAGYVEEVRKRSVSSGSNSSEKEEEAEKTRENWIKQHGKVADAIELIAGAFRVIGANRIHNPDLVQYASDVYGVLIVVEAVMGWIKEGNLSELTEPRERRWSLDRFGEPWNVSAAFVDDVAYAMLPPINPLTFIFGHRDREPINGMMTIRRTRRDDLQSMSGLRRTVPDDDIDSIFSTEIFIEKYYRPFLDWSEKHCFVAEDGMRMRKTPLASICGVPNIIDFYEHHNRIEAEKMNSDDECPSVPSWLPPLPTAPAVHHFTSFCDIRAKDEGDIHAAKRLIQTLAVVLAYEGSIGLYTCCHPCEREKVSMLLSIGFVELNSTHTDQILLGLKFVPPDAHFTDDEDEEDIEEEMEKEAKEENVEDRGDQDDY